VEVLPVRPLPPGNSVYVAELEDAGGVLVSATEDFDTTTATGKFGRGMLLEFSAFESDRAGKTWKEAFDHRVREGLPSLGRDRFGYRREGRARREDDPDRTRHVKVNPNGTSPTPNWDLRHSPAPTAPTPSAAASRRSPTS